jgi:hypothetical protein
MEADHGELAAPDRRSDVDAALACGHRRLRPRGEAADASGAVGDHGQRTERAVAAELELERLALLAADGEEHAAHERPAERRGGGG